MTLLGKSAERRLLTAACAVGLGLRLPWLLADAPVLLAVALLRGEPVWPHDWTPLIVLALLSQVAGQGLLVFALRAFPPMIIGLALLMQPAVAVLSGYLAFGETLGLLDLVGMAMVGAALAVARARVG